MSHNSIMQERSIPSALSAEEANRLFEEFRQRHPEGEHLRDYQFEVTDFPGDRSLSVQVKDDDYYGKHSADKALAEFMATITTPGKYGTLTFEGEDGEDWGYLIGRNEIRRMRKEWVLDNGVLLDTFLDSQAEA